MQPASGPRARAGRSGATASEQRGAEEFGEENGRGKRKELTAGPGLSARGGARERLSCGAWHWRAGWARGERCAGEAGEAGGLRGRATRAGVRESACWAWRGKRRERAGPKRELLGRRVGEREGRGPPGRGFGLGLGLLFWVWLGLFSITSSISFPIQTNSTKSN